MLFFFGQQVLPGIQEAAFQENVANKKREVIKLPF
jgi:hypothetical protein